MIAVELDFLTNDEKTQEACRMYWQLNDEGDFVHSVSRISEGFNLPRNKVASTIAAACRAFSSDDCCSDCALPRTFTSRADYTQRSRYGRSTTWICQDCYKTRQTEARRESERQLALVRKQLQEELDQKRYPGLSLNQLSFTDAIYLVSLLRSGGSEDLSYINPYETFKTALSTTSDFDSEILDHLYSRHLICIHPGSRPESLFHEDGVFTEYLPSKVHWILPLPEGGVSSARFFEDLESLLKADEWPKTWDTESAELHRAVALQECLQYLQVLMNEHGFEAKFGEKTLLVLKSILAKFSIGQTYSFIWRAARDAAAFYVREKTSKVHAANIVPGSIQRMAERALAEGWNIKPYHRDSRTPASQLSQVLFTLVLQLPEDGFTTRLPSPSESALSEKEDEIQDDEQTANEDVG